MEKLIVLIFIFIVSLEVQAQQTHFTHADTLRGSITPERAWWDVMRYDISVTPDFDKKYTSGFNNITYKVVAANHPDVMQIDLQQPLVIDSIIYDKKQSLSFSREGDVYFVKTEPHILHGHLLTFWFNSNHPLLGKPEPLADTSPQQSLEFQDQV